MVRPASFDSKGMKKGAWSEEEDNKLRNYIQRHGHPNWRLLPICAGLARCGKSCRLRWMNYLKPGLKRGNFSEHERDLIIKLHVELGNKWSAISANLPGRTDNEVKNYWHAHIQKRRNKGNSAVNKVIKTQMLKDDRSSEINFGNINQTETPSNNVNIPKSLSVENLENIDVVSSVVQADQVNNVMAEEFYQTYYEDLPPFVEEELDSFWLYQEMQNPINMSVFSECSDAGDSTAESILGDFWADQPLGEEAVSWYFGDILDTLWY